MNTNLLIGLGVAYLLGLPLILRLLCAAHTKVFIQRKIAKLPRGQQAKAAMPTPLWPKIRERIAFTWKDQRPFQLNAKKEPKAEGLSNKKIFLLLWIVGLLCFLAVAFTGKFVLLGLGFLFFCIAVGFSLTTASPIIKGRQDILTKMFEIGKSTLGLSAEHAANPGAVIQVLEWREILKPAKVKFQVPTTFGADSEEGFQRQFNQVFGAETTWVPFNDPETGKPGWNYQDGEVTLKETPPLPQMAPWSEHYVLDEGVAWSFFPLALGVENGVEIVNPKNGETENVLGFDVAGEQAGLSKKLGRACSPTITTSPMALCLTGDTLVAMEDGSLVAFKDLASTGDDARVLTVNSAGEVVPGLMVNPRRTRTDTPIVRVSFNEDGLYVDCTPDHLFRLEDGSYLRADRLRADSLLAPINGKALTVKHVRGEDLADVYDGAVPGVENFLIGFADSSHFVVVHNCAGGTGGGKALSVDTRVKTLSPAQS